MRPLIYIIVLALFFSGCVQHKNNTENEILVFCAASLTDVISEVTDDFEEESGLTVKLNLASSGTLARQIESGGQPGIFISANKKWLDYLIEKKLADAGSAKRIAGNKMVLIAPASSVLQPFEFSNDVNLPSLFEGRLSIGDPNHVPAGTYAVQVLKSLNCEKELESRFLPAKDVRSALMVVELGEVEAGIVYKTDALKSDKVKVLTEFPDSLHSEVGYYMGMLNGAKNDRALELYNYIVSDKMKPVWKKYGFEQ